MSNQSVFNGIIRTSVYPSGECVSTGSTFDRNGKGNAWEYIGRYDVMNSLIDNMRENEIEFQHVVTRHTS